MDTTPEAELDAPEAPTDVEVAARDMNALAMDLHRALASAPDANVFASPFSITLALAMTWLGAEGDTADELRRALHASLPEARFHAAISSLRAALQGDCTLAIANGLFAQRGRSFRAPFLSAMREHHASEVARVDFEGDRAGAATRINAWVTKHTCGAIRRLVTPADLPGGTLLFLVNATRFAGKWETPFDEEETRRGSFHLAEGLQVQAQFMKATRGLDHAAVDGVRLLRLPFQDGRTSMLVILPSRPGGLPFLEARLNPQTLERWIAALRPETVDLALPRFQLDVRSGLRELLEGLGLASAFDSERADLSGMRRLGPRLSIGDILHQATIEVDELGVVAAAVTGSRIMAGMRRPRKPVAFHADRPFLFLIRDESSGAILFLGRLSDPR